MPIWKRNLIVVWFGMFVSSVGMSRIAPLWGRAADKFGRKPMLLRASLGLAAVAFSVGFARNVHELIGLRSPQGAITGSGNSPSRNMTPE
ncbi:MAG: MFS transporter [Treponema sp.]|nr:MFS transporter [Treponema sp.]